MDLDVFLQNVMTTISDYRSNARAYPEYEHIKFIDYCMENSRHSRSQLFQDLFVLYHLREKTGGFFVEFGAANGFDLSNSYLLEKRFFWRGILAEPARCWRDALSANRSCRIDNRCVWERTGDALEFNETSIPEISTINKFSDGDMHTELRQNGQIYDVPTVSLMDLLIEHGAPKVIDYLSIDTEGSEINILRSFDFYRFDVRIITVEHNYTSAREEIYDLLISVGFRRVFEGFSRFDDWYVRV
jgi:FkbM family methyltransferase